MTYITVKLGHDLHLAPTLKIRCCFFNPRNVYSVWRFTRGWERSSTHALPWWSEAKTQVRKYEGINWGITCFPAPLSDIWWPESRYTRQWKINAALAIFQPCGLWVDVVVRRSIINIRAISRWPVINRANVRQTRGWKHEHQFPEPGNLISSLVDSCDCYEVLNAPILESLI